MGRLPSLKTILLILICLGVLLILGFISQCQQLQGGGVLAGQLRHHPQQAALHSPYVDRDREMDYYRGVNNQDGKTDDWTAKRNEKNNLNLDQDQFKGDYNFKEDPYNLEDKEMEVYHEGRAGGGGDAPVKIGSNTNREENAIAPILKTSDVRDISCDINNGRYMIPCKASGHDVFIPFSFIEKEFEISGHLDEKSDTFVWLHSNAKVIRPKGRYNPTGVFTYFENYQVESRDRVKCISGKFGVPISTQWSSQGYFYPIQIAQFGLSHFSKFLAEGEPKRTIIEDGDDYRGSWMPSSVSLVSVSQDSNDLLVNNVVQMDNTAGNITRAFNLRLDEISPNGNNANTLKQLVLSWDMKITSCPFGCVLNVTITVSCDSKTYSLYYVNDDYLIDAKDPTTFAYGMGHSMEKDWQHVIRDVHIDTQKGLNLKSSSSKKTKGHQPKIAKSKLSLLSFSFSLSPGMVLLIDNLTMSNAEHMAQFYQAADWFVINQDAMGGWPIPVKRKFSSSDFPAVLPPGWNSGMSQGHALSLLSRAYYFSNSSTYKNALIQAVSQIFDLTGPQKGVRTKFLDKYVWFEEYPTTPSSFVLNGFMYALLGLYDLKMIKVSGGASAKAGKLYEEGIQSLKVMLPLFDTGSGTMYDLRHFTVPGVTPNLARIDYHVTHINQLLTFATFEADPIFKSTAERWIGYTIGKRAPHN